MNIQWTDKLNAEDGIKALVYSRSGVGKTMLAATAPNPIIFSAEKGLLSLRKMKVPYIDVSSYKELTEAFSWAMKSAESKKFDTLCLDSISEIAEVILAEEMRKNKDPRKAYGETQQQVWAIIRAFRDMPKKNVYFIGKALVVEITENFQSYKREIPILPSDKLQQSAPYFFDLVLHLYTGIDPTTNATYRAIHTQASKEWEAKDRSGNLDTIEFPNLLNIFKKAAA